MKLNLKQKKYRKKEVALFICILLVCSRFSLLLDCNSSKHDCHLLIPELSCPRVFVFSDGNSTLMLLPFAVVFFEIRPTWYHMLTKQDYFINMTHVSKTKRCNT